MVNQFTGGSIWDTAPEGPSREYAPDGQYDAQGRFYEFIGGQWVPNPAFDDFTQAAGYRAPSTAQPPAPPTPQTYTAINGDLVGIDPRSGAEVYRIPGVTFAQLSPQEQRAIELGDIAAARRYSTSERIAGEQFAAGENAADRTFRAGESAADRQFTGKENALDRALRAGDFAASIQIQNETNRFQADRDYQQARERYTQQQLSGAQQVADNISNVDPGALPAFYAAGGGVIANALARGATAQSDMANLGSARALSAVENAAPPERFTFNPATFDPSAWLNFGQPPGLAATAAPTAQPQAPQPRTWDVGTATPISPTGSAAGYAGMQANAANGVATAFDSEGTNWTMADGKWTERFATGTQGDIPAPQQFISGDAMAADPAAGGARPELVTVDDPEGNARLSVDPLAPGGGGGQSQMGPLFRAIADFLDGSEPAPMDGMAAGGMPPRFATGTDPVASDWMMGGVQPTDQPYLDRIRDIRTNVDPGNLNPFDVGFQNVAPSLQNRFVQGRQTKYGVPVQDQVAEINQFRLPGTSRGSLALGF